MNGTINKRNYWTSENGKSSLWYRTVQGSAKWVIGATKDIGEDKGYIMTNDDVESWCPLDDKHSYRYWNGRKKTPATYIKLNCVSKGMSFRDHFSSCARRVG